VLGGGIGAAQEDEAGKQPHSRADETAPEVRSGGAAQSERAAALPGSAAANVVRGESARLGAPAALREPAAPGAPGDGGERSTPRVEASGRGRDVGANPGSVRRVADGVWARRSAGDDVSSSGGGSGGCQRSGVAGSASVAQASRS